MNNMLTYAQWHVVVLFEVLCSICKRLGHGSIIISVIPLKRHIHNINVIAVEYNSDAQIELQYSDLAFNE